MNAIFIFLTGQGNRFFFLKYTLVNLLVFDNYDSFTYNLVHYAEKILNRKVDVRENDRISLDELTQYDRIILSPGPGLPSESGILLSLIRELAPHKPMLGVCLGHQAIAEAFGAGLENLDDVFHGVASEILITDKEELLFSGMGPEITVGRYHSWSVSRKGLPDCLRVTAEDGEGRIMALRHTRYDLCSVQFHPESIMTDQGEKMMANWLLGPENSRLNIFPK